jgi:hypothetical protein
MSYMFKMDLGPVPEWVAISSHVNSTIYYNGKMPYSLYLGLKEMNMTALEEGFDPYSMLPKKPLRADIPHESLFTCSQINFDGYDVSCYTQGYYNGEYWKDTPPDYAIPEDGKWGSTEPDNEQNESTEQQ